MQRHNTPFCFFPFKKSLEIHVLFLLLNTYSLLYPHLSKINSGLSLVVAKMKNHENIQELWIVSLNIYTFIKNSQKQLQLLLFPLFPCLSSSFRLQGEQSHFSRTIKWIYFAKLFLFLTRDFLIRGFAWIGKTVKTTENSHAFNISLFFIPKNCITHINYCSCCSFRLTCPDILFVAWDLKTCLAAQTRSRDDRLTQTGSVRAKESATSHHQLRQQVKSSSKTWMSIDTWHRSMLYSFVKTKSLFLSILSHNMASKWGPARNLAAWPWNKGSVAIPDYASE